MLDTHKSTPASDWGPSPSLLPPNFSGPPDYLSELKTKRTLNHQRKTQKTERPEQPEQTVYSSVFQPKPEQQHVCSLASTHRQLVQKSEYAAVDALELQLHNNEMDMRQQRKAASCAAQRHNLEAQVDYLKYFFLTPYPSSCIVQQILIVFS